MNKKTKNNLIIAGIIVLLVGLAAGLLAALNSWSLPESSDTTTDTTSDSEDISTDPDSQPAGLAMNRPTAQMRAIGDTVVLTATVSLSNASDKRVTWTTSDVTKIAIASSINTSTGGTATIRCETSFDSNVTITATTVDGGHTATCTVNYYMAVESIVINPQVSHDPMSGSFLYYNGSDYYAKTYNDQDETAFNVDVVVAPATASAVASTTKLLTYTSPSWISSTSNFISKTVSNSWFRGAITFDEVNDTATIPLRLAADFTSIQGGDLTIALDGITASLTIELYIAVTGISVNPPTHTF